jgi:hypothetical protein
MSAAFPARYPGKCAGCGDWFGVDEQIAYADDELMHADCATDGPPPPLPTRPPCPSCWTIHAGECM